MENEKVIWDHFKAKGLNDFGIAGLMGNLYAESGLLPNNLQNTGNKKLGMTDDEYVAAVDNGSYQNFVKDSQGFGLAQWTYWSRKQNLLNFARAAGKSIGDLQMQLDFLWKELSEGYSSVLQTLKTASSILVASNAVLLKFERPADQSETVQKKRAGFGQIYYNKFAGSSVQEPKEANNMTAVERLLQTARNEIGYLEKATNSNLDDKTANYIDVDILRRDVLQIDLIDAGAECHIARHMRRRDDVVQRQFRPAFQLVGVTGRSSEPPPRRTALARGIDKFDLLDYLKQTRPPRYAEGFERRRDRETDRFFRP